jgi:hypothetical protein
MLETHSPGQVFRNILVGSLCEFDAVVEDYPVMTFVEIKRYREDFKPDRVRRAVIKLREDCTTIVNSTEKWNCTWLPYRNKRQESEKGKVTKMELLLAKLNIKQTEGWRFRMVLIVPHEIYYKVLLSLHGYFVKSDKGNPKNLIEIDGIPLLVVRDTAIEGAFS